MELAKLPTSSVVIPASREPRVRKSVDVAVPAERMVQFSNVDGAQWCIRAGAERWVRSMPAQAWGDPLAAGWSLVKSNPRRDVWRFQAAGEGFYAKFYFGGNGFRHLRERFVSSPYRSEWEGGLYALRHGIPAVAPVACAKRIRRNGREAAVLVTQALELASPLHEFWRQLQSDADRTRRRTDTAQLFERLAELIARAHQAGFEHTDMHAANILVQTIGPRQYRCAFVDLHSARMGAAISDHAVVRNLAQLNQWFRKNSPVTDRIRFLRAYFRWRGEFEVDFDQGRPLGFTFESLLDALEQAASSHAQGLWSRRDRRGDRTGRYFAALRLSEGWRGHVYLLTKHPTAHSPASRRVFSAAWWRQQWPEILRALNAPDSAPTKNSHSARVVTTVLEHPDGPMQVIVKRPLARNWRRALAQSFPPSRGRRGWWMGNALLNRDVPAARPLALFERRIGPLVRDSVLVTERVPDASDLEQHLRMEQARCSPREWAGQKQALIDILVRLLRGLEDRWIAHRDCKAGNILICRRPALGAIWIDMDGLRLRRQPLARAEVLAPLARLHVSLLQTPGLTRTDRARFLRRYFARFGASRSAWRTAWHELTPLVSEKLKAADARRAWKLRTYGRA